MVRDTGLSGVGSVVAEREYQLNIVPSLDGGALVGLSGSRGNRIRFRWYDDPGCDQRCERSAEPDRGVVGEWSMKAPFERLPSTIGCVFFDSLSGSEPPQRSVHPGRSYVRITPP